MNQRLYDFSSLNELTAGDERIKKTVINLFITHIPEDLKRIENALKEKNYKLVSSIAHKIKPSVNYICVNQLYDDLQAIEKWEGKDEAMVKKIRHLINTLSLVLTQLQSI
jgi:HPt (histidine-containing phosphotransfer) domain-containing protein